MTDKFVWQPGELQRVPNEDIVREALIHGPPYAESDDYSALAALDRLVAERDALLSIHDKKRDAGRGGSTHWATCHLSHLDCANLKRELAEAERDRLRELLGRIRQWDDLYGAEDGHYWQREIDSALGDSDD